MGLAAMLLDCCLQADPRMRLWAIRMRSSEEDDLTVPPLVNYLLAFLLISTVFAGDTDDISVTGAKLGSLGEPSFFRISHIVYATVTEGRALYILTLIVSAALYLLFAWCSKCILNSKSSPAFPGFTGLRICRSSVGRISDSNPLV